MSGQKALLTAAVAVAAGNVAILAAVDLARRRAGSPLLSDLPAQNAHLARAGLLRSGWPGRHGYAAAAGLGVRTVVDLRAEGGAGPDPALGIDHVVIPIRDGQPPHPEQVERFRDVVRSAPGEVLVHCAAGVGRTGSMLAAYEILEHGVAPRTAATRMLAVGPPSLEQIAFVLGGARPPPPPVVAVSRILDAPRRTWSRLRGWWRHR